jgi:hypothetical protein
MRMEPANRAVFLNISKKLNEEIAGLSRAIEAGELPPGLLERVRRSSDAGLAGLRAIAGGESVDPDISKVMEHLDLVSTLTDTVESAPDLSKKLLTHLLEEQMEITAAAGGPGAAIAPVTAVESKAAEQQPLPGGRRPLTVGSLIKR